MPNLDLVILLTLLVVNLALLPLFVILIRKTSARWVIVFLGAAALFGVLNALFTVLSFGGAFGPGVLLFFSACLIAPVSFLLLLILWRSTGRVLGNDRGRRVLYWAGGLSVIVLQAAPLLGNLGIGGYCDRQTERVGDTIVAAVREYQANTGNYPASLQELIPKYLNQLPTSSCLGAAGPTAEFRLEQCRPAPMLLTTRSFDGARVIRYNFATGNWSAISFLDGACSFLR